MRLTQHIPYPEVNSILESLQAQIRAVLREKLVGLYLYGSLVTGDFDTEISDLDLLAAIAADLDDAESQSLNVMHGNFARAHPQWNNRVEVAYLSLTGLQTFKSKRSKLAIISPGEPFHIIYAGIDWLMNWYLVREHGLVLCGPPPEEIIDCVTQEEFIHAVREHVQASSDWLEKQRYRKAQAYTILTMCRSLYTLQHGEHVSKRQAALWAQHELPEWSELINNALLWRAASNDEHVDHEATYPETVRFVHMVHNRIIY